MPWWDLVPAGPAVGRSTERELLDEEELDLRELRINLREMAMLNRLPGGTGASVAALRWAARGVEEPLVLDVGTGLGDFAKRLRRQHPQAKVTAVDSRNEVLDLARRNLAPTNSVTLLEADARALPFEDGSFHAAHASLLLHHLEPTDAVVALREMRRIATHGVVVNDLRRGRAAVAITSITVLALARGRYTRNDGPLSARRAYTLAELDALASAAGLSPAWRTPTAWPRVTTVYR